MKHYLLILFLSSCSFFAVGQGTVHVAAGTHVKVTGGMSLVLENSSLINNGSLQQVKGDGILNMTGTTDASLSGTGVSVLDQLHLNKGTGKLQLQSHLQVVGTVQFNSGLLDLDNYMLDLGTTGLLSNESESSRAYTLGSGYLKALVTSPASSFNAGNLGAVISTMATLGATEVRRGHAPQNNVLGVSSSTRRYYDITPTDNTAVKATLRFFYFDAELNEITESSLSLWRSTNNGWSNLGSNSKDATANYVEKNNIQSFSRMTLAPGCPTINVTIPDVYAVNPGGAANTLYIGYGPSSIILNAQITGGTAPYTYKWTIGSSGKTVIGTGASITVSPAATTTYYLNVSDASGCSSAAITRTISIVDVRCGPKLDKVTVCALQRGKFTTSCVSSNTVPDYLSNGSYLGACQLAPLTRTSQREEIVVENNRLSVTAFPNPSAHYFTLLMRSGSDQAINLRVMDLLGRVLESKVNVAANGTLRLGSNYRPGVYLAEVVQGKEKVIVKLVKAAQ